MTPLQQTNTDKREDRLWNTT